MNYAIILSGGTGTRMREDGFPKQYLIVRGKPVIMYAIEPFISSEEIDEIIIVAQDVWQDQISEWLRAYNVTKPIRMTSGGNTRQASVLQGLLACTANHAPGPTDKVLIHEAARPLVSSRMIHDCICALDQYDSCLPVIPSNDSMFISDDRITVSDLIDRDKLFCGQAPEGFHLQMYLDLNTSCPEHELDSIRGGSVLSFIKGHTVGLIEGDPCNFKLTRPQDLMLFEAHLTAQTMQKEQQS